MYVKPGDSVIMVWPADTEPQEIIRAVDYCARQLPGVRILHVTDKIKILVQRAGSETYYNCGCLRNDAEAHRVGCPEYPQGRCGD